MLYRSAKKVVELPLVETRLQEVGGGASRLGRIGESQEGAQGQGKALRQRPHGRAPVDPLVPGPVDPGAGPLPIPR